MIRIKFDSAKFQKEMSNLTDYAVGFLEGTQRGKVELLKEVGEKTKQILGEYIDANARINPESLHHVYEWYRTGSPEARLFDLSYNAAAGSLSVNATFRQSTSIKNGSRTPFYDKASIMEKGISVRISPKNTQALAFEDNATEVFVRGQVEVSNPGGAQVAGGFQKIFSEFFEKYFTQSFMMVSGLDQRLRNPAAFVRGFRSAKTGGKNLGRQVGYRWVAGKGGM
jgi:hypothetical protein